MKLKVELDKNETVEEAEEALEKAIKTKIQSRKEYYSSERYADQAIEDFHKLITDQHAETVEETIKEVQQAIMADLRGY